MEQEGVGLRGGYSAVALRVKVTRSAMRAATAILALMIVEQHESERLAQGHST